MAVTGDACNRNQYLGNRSSTRVHAAPGGNSSFSLGWSEPEQAVQRPAAPVQVPVQAPAVEEAKENFQPAPLNVPAEQVKATGAIKQSSNAWASNQSQNCGNVLSERPTTRIHAPPGGKSSICF
eukprot:TRINITY_DN4660_c0_g1_i1.p1 TRINITY_DN4660_c0_g1~~TRINITY_DN4660_c0_g1_i1.p1  ORF type:complete len:124 (+),score=27.10 TRINITY_DN4660_c0_g1_i1:67-438(+)